MAGLDGTTPSGRRWPVGWTFAGGAVFVASVASHFRTPLLPAIADELVMTSFVIGLITTMFGLGRVATDLPAGYLADRLGPSGMFGLSGALIALGSATFALAPGPGSVLVGAFTLGMASAMANTAGTAFFLMTSDRARRGRAMAAFSAALLVGQAIGPTVSGSIGSIGTWRTAMGIAGLMGFALLLAGVGARSRRVSLPARPDLAASASGAAARQSETSTDGSTAGPAMARSARWALYGVSFAMMFTLGAMPQTLVPIIGGDALGLTVATIGVALGIGGLARLVGTLIGGWLSDRFPRKLVLVPGMGMYGAGVALLVAEDSVWLWFASIVLMSLASFGIATASAMIGDRVEAARLGREIGVFRFVGDLGLLVGPVLAAYVLGAVGQRAAVLLVVGVVAASTAALAALVPARGGRGGFAA